MAVEVFVSDNHQGRPYDARNLLRTDGVSIGGCPRYDLGSEELLWDIPGRWVARKHGDGVIILLSPSSPPRFNPLKSTIGFIRNPRPLPNPMIWREPTDEICMRRRGA